MIQPPWKGRKKSTLKGLKGVGGGVRAHGTCPLKSRLFFNALHNYVFMHFGFLLRVYKVLLRCLGLGARRSWVLRRWLGQGAGEYEVLRRWLGQSAGKYEVLRIWLGQGTGEYEVLRRWLGQGASCTGGSDEKSELFRSENKHYVQVSYFMLFCGDHNIWSIVFCCVQKNNIKPMIKFLF